MAHHFLLTTKSKRNGQKKKERKKSFMSQQNNLVDVSFKKWEFLVTSSIMRLWCSWNCFVLYSVSGFMNPVISQSYLEWSIQIYLPVCSNVRIEKNVKPDVSPRMLASSSSAPVWRICMSFTTPGMQSKSLDDFLRTLQYKNAATLMTRNGDTKKFGIWY